MENGFPEQYHPFDMPVLVSQLPGEEIGLKNTQPFQEALPAAMPPAMPSEGRVSPEQAPGAAHTRALAVK